MSLESTLDRARDGDAVAFNELVDAFQSDAYHVARHQLGHADDALDACQEAMLSAWRALRSFDGDVAQFRRWLLTIVVNACRDRARYERRRPHEPLEREVDGQPMAMPLPDSGEAPEAYAQRADLGQLLTRALGRLSEDHRIVILMDHAGYSYAEIAAAVGVEVGTVKSRLSRARAHMRDLLTGEEAIEPYSEPPGPEPPGTSWRYRTMRPSSSGHAPPWRDVPDRHHLEGPPSP